MEALGPVTLDNVANGILIVIVGLLSWLGINRGRKAKDEDDAAPSRQVELAGAVIDNRRADMIAEAIDRNTHALRDHAALFEGIRSDLRDARTEIRALTMELVRAR